MSVLFCQRVGQLCTCQKWPKIDFRFLIRHHNCGSKENSSFFTFTSLTGLRTHLYKVQCRTWQLSLFWLSNVSFLVLLTAHFVILDGPEPWISHCSQSENSMKRPNLKTCDRGVISLQPITITSKPQKRMTDDLQSCVLNLRGHVECHRSPLGPGRPPGYVARIWTIRSRMSGLIAWFFKRKNSVSFLAPAFCQIRGFYRPMVI